MPLDVLSWPLRDRREEIKARVPSEILTWGSRESSHEGLKPARYGFFRIWYTH